MTHVNIFVLPNEIWSEIFRIVAFSQPISNVHHLRSGRTWLSITRTCLLWRNISLGDARLWSNVVLQLPSLAWGKEFLARAGAAMVDLTVRCLTVPPSHEVSSINALSETANLISTHLSHTHSLRIHSRQRNIIEYLLQSLVAGAGPVGIRSLCLGLDAGVSEGSTIAAPASILRAVPLQTLALDCLFFDWSSGIYTGLVHLSLHAQDRLCAPSMQTFLCILENCPALETLEVVDAGPLHEEDHSAYEPVMLSRLRRLTLQNWSKDLKYLLQYLIFPTSAQVTLAFTGSGEKYNEVSDVFPPACTPLLTKAARSHITHIRSLGGDHITGRLEVYAEDGAERGSALTVIVCSIYAARLVTALASFFSQYTEHLIIRQPLCASPLWLDHLHKYSRLRALETDVNAAKLASTLDEVDEQGNLICPNLTTVIYAGESRLSPEERRQILHSLESRR